MREVTPSRASKNQNRTLLTRLILPRTRPCSNLSLMRAPRMSQTNDHPKTNVELSSNRISNEGALIVYLTTWCRAKKANRKLSQRSSTLWWTPWSRPNRSHFYQITRGRARPFLCHPDIPTTSQKWRRLGKPRAPPSSPTSWTRTLSPMRSAL